MRKIFASLIILSTSVLNAEINLELDTDLTDNVSVPVDSVDYILSTKEVLIKTELPIICEVGGTASASDLSLIVEDPNGKIYSPIELSGGENSPTYDLNNRSFKVKTNDMVSVRAQADENRIPTRDLASSICLTYNDDIIFEYDAETSDVYSKSTFVQNYDAANGDIVNVLKLTVDVEKNNSRADRDIVYFYQNNNKLKYTITLQNLTNTNINNLSLKEFVSLDGPAHLYAGGCLLVESGSSTPEFCGDIFDGFEMDTLETRTFEVTRERMVINENGGDWSDEFKMMLALFKKESSNQGLVYYASVEGGFRVRYMD